MLCNSTGQGFDDGNINGYCDFVSWEMTDAHWNLVQTIAKQEIKKHAK